MTGVQKNQFLRRYRESRRLLLFVYLKRNTIFFFFCMHAVRLYYYYYYGIYAETVRPFVTHVFFLDVYTNILRSDESMLYNSIVRIWFVRIILFYAFVEGCVTFYFRRVKKKKNRKKRKLTIRLQCLRRNCERLMITLKCGRHFVMRMKNNYRLIITSKTINILFCSNLMNIDYENMIG